MAPTSPPNTVSSSGGVGKPLSKRGLELLEKLKDRRQQGKPVNYYKLGRRIGWSEDEVEVYPRGSAPPYPANKSQAWVDARIEKDEGLSSTLESPPPDPPTPQQRQYRLSHDPPARRWQHQRHQDTPPDLPGDTLPKAPDLPDDPTPAVLDAAGELLSSTQGVAGSSPDPPMRRLRQRHQHTRSAAVLPDGPSSPAPNLPKLPGPFDSPLNTRQHTQLATAPSSVTGSSEWIPGEALQAEAIGKDLALFRWT